MSKDLKLAVVAVFAIAAVITLNTYLKPSQQDLDINQSSSVVSSDYVSANIKIKQRVGAVHGEVTTETEKVIFTARKDIKQGESFEVDLGIHTSTRPVQYSNFAILANAGSNGLGIALACIHPIIGTWTGDVFMSATGVGEFVPELGIGFGIGKIIDINKHVLLGYDIISGRMTFGVGLRW